MTSVTHDPIAHLLAAPGSVLPVHPDLVVLIGYMPVAPGELTREIHVHTKRPAQDRVVERLVESISLDCQKFVTRVSTFNGELFLRVKLESENGTAADVQQIAAVVQRVINSFVKTERQFCFYSVELPACPIDLKPAPTSTVARTVRFMIGAAQEIVQDDEPSVPLYLWVRGLDGTAVRIPGLTILRAEGNGYWADMPAGSLAYINLSGAPSITFYHAVSLKSQA